MNDPIILSPHGDGISVLFPCECGLSLQQIARKDTPAGLPFVIADASELPTDTASRAAWRADFSKPDGYGIGPEAFAIENAIKPTPEPTPEPAPAPTPEPGQEPTA